MPTLLPLRAPRLLAACVALLAALPLAAEVRLAALFSDHTVLQREQPVPVWGTARRGETVTVAFRGQTLKAKADKQGRWRTTLAPMPANAEPATLTVSGSSKQVVHDVLVGDVWICSGQSNMEWPLRLATHGPAEAAAARLPALRHFKVERARAASPVGDVKGAWAVCSPETAPHFTAVGFFFARDLHARLGVPIGLINSTWGGTPVEAWMSAPMIAANPQAPALKAYWEKLVAEHPPRKAAHDLALAEWERLAAAARAAGQPGPPNRPWRPAGPDTEEEPSVVWNGMVSPLVPYGIRGVVWYQGEGNAGRPESYRDLFAGLITGWRQAWAESYATAPASAPPPAPPPAFPFLFVQLPNWKSWKADATEWALLREAQAQTLAVSDTGMAVTLDLGDSDDLHPPAKHEVGRRLALVARATVFGEGIDASGPVYAGHSVEGGAIRVRFTGAQIGLVCHGPRLNGFSIAGADGAFVPATARIESGGVVVSSEAVSEPVALSYAWANDPQPPPNLYNGAGLPAAPFRTPPPR